MLIYEWDIVSDNCVIATVTTSVNDRNVAYAKAVLKVVDSPFWTLSKPRVRK